MNVFNGDDISGSFPHYNILKIDENRYRITIALAGFTRDNIGITQKQSSLTVSGEINSNNESYLHRGITARKFERHFQLAEHVEVSSAGMENGLLHIDLMRRIPEELQPKKIEINNFIKKTKKAA